MSDLMPISCTDNRPTDIDNTLMQISISGRPTCSVEERVRRYILPNSSIRACQGTSSIHDGR